MSWLLTIVTAILCALAGGVGMLGISSACVKWYRISSFEGGSGYFVVGLTLVGAIVGFMVGLIAARVGVARLGDHWYFQLGAGLGTVAVLLAAVLAITYVKADHVPERGGRGLVVAWEVRLPLPGDEFGPRGNPADWPDTELKLQLVSVLRRQTRGHESATFDRAAFRQEEGQWILPARVPLFTSKGEFCVNLTLGGRDDGFWPLMLKPEPTDNQFEWSPWYRTNKGREKPDDTQAVMYRFKFERGPEPAP